MAISTILAPGESRPAPGPPDPTFCKHQQHAGSVFTAVCFVGSGMQIAHENLQPRADLRALPGTDPGKAGRGLRNLPGIAPDFLRANGRLQGARRRGPRSPIPLPLNSRTHGGSPTVSPKIFNAVLLAQEQQHNDSNKKEQIHFLNPGIYNLAPTSSYHNKNKNDFLK